MKFIHITLRFTLLYLFKQNFMLFLQFPNLLLNSILLSFYFLLNSKNILIFFKLLLVRLTSFFYPLYISLLEFLQKNMNFLLKNLPNLINLKSFFLNMLEKPNKLRNFHIGVFLVFLLKIYPLFEAATRVKFLNKLVILI